MIQENFSGKGDEVEGPSKSPRESPPPSPKEDQPQLPPMEEQPQLECKIELCTPDIVDLHIINLQDARRPFKIKVTTIHMVQHSPFTDVAEALERFNEYMRAEFLEWHIEEDGEDGERSSRPKGCRGKIHMRGV
jgi:hypothetical protein